MTGGKFHRNLQHDIWVERSLVCFQQQEENSHFTHHKRNIFTLCGPGETSPGIPSLYLVPCYSREVGTQLKFQQDSEESLWSWAHWLNIPCFWLLGHLNSQWPHSGRLWKPWKIPREILVPTSIWRLNSQRRKKMIIAPGEYGISTRDQRRYSFLKMH